MRIQNTEMEFISFDAQDVITTSGGPVAGQGMVALGQALVDSGKQFYEWKGNSVSGYKTWYLYFDTNSGGEVVKNDPALPNTNLFQADSKAAKPRENMDPVLVSTSWLADDAAAVLAWLSANGIQ